MKPPFLTISPRQTQKLGENLAKKILRRRLTKTAFVVGLRGDLGGGKTTFLQGFAKGLRVKEKILSPTFNIFRRFQISSLRFQNFYHIDCYRIQKQKEILDLGFKEIVSNPRNIVAIEWAERIKKIIPKKTIWVNFKFVGKKRRRIFVTIPTI